MGAGHTANFKNRVLKVQDFGYFDLSPMNPAFHDSCLLAHLLPALSRSDKNIGKLWVESLLMFCCAIISSSPMGDSDQTA